MVARLGINTRGPLIVASEKLNMIQQRGHTFWTRERMMVYREVP